MDLNKLETQILIDVYDADMTAECSIKVQDYELDEDTTTEKIQEFAFYLGKLKRLGFITYEEDKAFINGGWQNTKYKNNVVMIWGDKIHIGSRGITLVEEVRKTVVEKFKERGVDVVKGLAGAVKDEFNGLFAKTLAEYLKRITGQGQQ